MPQPVARPVTMPSMDLIDAYIAHIKAAGLSPRTARDRRRCLIALDRQLPLGLAQATIEELEEWLARDDWSAQTRSTYYGHIRGFFLWATDPRRARLDYDPSASLRRPRAPRGVPRPAADATVARLLHYADAPWLWLVPLAAYAGLRCMELAGITTDDITEDTIRVVGKGGKTRVIPTSPVIWPLLQRHPGGLLAGGLPAEKLTVVGNRALRRTARCDVTWHRLRHWFATSLLDQGVNLRTVQELMGHASPQTTAIYTQITDRQRQMAIAALPALTPASA